VLHAAVALVQLHVCLHLQLGTLLDAPTSPPIDPLPALRTIKALVEPLGMLLLPPGAGARRFVSQTLRPRFESQLPRTLDALEAVLADDDDDDDDDSDDAGAAPAAAAQVLHTHRARPSASRSRNPTGIACRGFVAREVECCLLPQAGGDNGHPASHPHLVLLHLATSKSLRSPCFLTAQHSSSLTSI
jgi:hypothetical protein